MPTINKTKAWLSGLTLFIAVCIIYETSSRSKIATVQNVPIQRIQSNISHRQELALFWNEADYKKRLPKCIIVGVRKAGTRALKDFLSIHPRIVVAKREQHFFGLPLKYRKGLDYYRKKMPKSRPDQITIEKTPAYFFQPRAAMNMKKMNSSIKIIVIVREPVSRAVSEYIQFDYNEGKTKPFEHYAMRAPNEVNSRNFRIQNSKYYYNARMWLKIFPRKQIHFVNGDTLIRDPVTELKKVETFLGLDHYISEDNLVFNTTKGFFCWIEPDGSEHCQSPNKGRPHPKIDDNVRETLTEYFRPYNKRFFRLIGEDFGWPT